MSFRSAIVRFRTPVTAGVVRYYGALGGLTPKLALFVLTYDDIATSPASPFCVLGIGATDGTRQRAISTRAQHNVGNTNTYRNSRNDACVLLTNSSADSIAYQGSFSSFGPDYIDVNWTTLGTLAFNGYIVLFGGTDLTAYVGSVNLGSSAGAINVTAPGFQPDSLIAFGNAAAVNTSNAQMGLTFGLAAVYSSVLTQRCIGWVETDNLAAAAPRAHLSTSFVAIQKTTTADTLDYSVTLSGFTATGFDLSLSASAGGDELMYVAMSLGGRSVRVVTLTSPTSTGNQTNSDFGFQPVFGLLVGSYLSAVDTSVGAAGSSSFALAALRGDDAVAAAWRDKWAADPTDTGCVMVDKAFVAPSDSSLSAIEASLVSLDANGWTLNFSAVDGTARKGFALAIGGSEATEVFMSALKSYVRARGDLGQVRIATLKAYVRAEPEAAEPPARPRIAWIM